MPNVIYINGLFIFETDHFVSVFRFLKMAIKMVSKKDDFKSRKKMTRRRRKSLVESECSYFLSLSAIITIWP